MADHDPMDLNVRSQAFYQQFYLHHKNSCDAWYKKDANHIYVDASISFLSRFLPSGMNTVIGLDDTAITSVSERDIHLMYDFENQVMVQNKEIVLLSWGYFSDNNDVKSFVLRIQPYRRDENGGIIVYITDLFEENKRSEWFSSLIASLPKTHPGVVKGNSLYFNPLSCVTDKEWEVAWLIICGCSIRWIARYLDMRSQAVNIKSRNVYMKLRVFNKNGLLQMAQHYRWINVIPKRYISMSNLIRIS